MKSILCLTLVVIFMILSCIQKSDQDLKKLYSEYCKKQSQINLIQYRVNRIDTFTTGQVWNINGNATLERDTRDSIFNFSFFGKRDDVDRENIYVENKHFQIFPNKKTYRIENNYGIHVLGAPGGQMIIEDLLNPDTTNSSISIVDKDSDSFIIVKKKLSESTTITKYLTISKSSLLPVKILKTVKDTVRNIKSSTTFNISNVLIGDQVTNNEIDNLTLLSGFTEEKPIIDKTADTLIGQKIPELIVRTLSNKDLKYLSSKVVLLDFWELWCGPCLNSLPKINNLFQKYSSSNLIVIGITKSKMEDVNKYLRANEIKFSQVQGTPKLYNFFKVNSSPIYVLIDKKGIVRYIYYGYSEEIESKIKSLI